MLFASNTRLQAYFTIRTQRMNNPYAYCTKLEGKDEIEFKLIQGTNTYKLEINTDAMNGT